MKQWCEEYGSRFDNVEFDGLELVELALDLVTNKRKDDAMPLKACLNIPTGFWLKILKDSYIGLSI